MVYLIDFSGNKFLNFKKAFFGSMLLVLLDRNYSFGNFIDYRRVLKSNFILNKREGDHLQLNFSLGQQGFTPDEFDEVDTDLYDYTNAGWLFLNSEIVRLTENNGLSLVFEFGFTGKKSFADKVQQETHRFLQRKQKPLWVDQIPTRLLINFKGGYRKELLSIKKYFYIDELSNVALGFKDIYADQEIFISFGRRAKMHQTSLFNAISAEKEYYGYVAGGYRFVAYNHLLEGSFVRKNIRAKDHFFTSIIFERYF